MYVHFDSTSDFSISVDCIIWPNQWIHEQRSICRCRQRVGQCWFLLPHRWSKIWRHNSLGGDWRHLSGATLLSYLTLKELDRTKGGNIRFWGLFFIHRYIRFLSCLVMEWHWHFWDCRLTGLYAIVLGLQSTLVKFFGTGIQSATIEYGVNACKETWWFHLLNISISPLIHWRTK